MRERIYVAGPMTIGDAAVNVRNAILAANQLADLGFCPFLPHLTHFWHLVCPRPYEFWIGLDSQFLQFCHGLLRLDGTSMGADREVALAKSINIPIFYTVEGVGAYFAPKEIKL